MSALPLLLLIDVKITMEKILQDEDDIDKMRKLIFTATSCD